MTWYAVSNVDSVTGTDRTKAQGNKNVNIIYIAILILAAFIAIWIFVVVPAEKRHHERKLKMIKKKIAEREVVRQDAGSDELAQRADESGRKQEHGK